MNEHELKKAWMEEEEAAHIHGWDFSHIHGRYEEEMGLPLDYRAIIKEYLTPGQSFLTTIPAGANFCCHWGIPSIIYLRRKGMSRMSSCAGRSFCP